MIKTTQLGAKQEQGFYEMVVLQGEKIGGYLSANRDLQWQCPSCSASLTLGFRGRGCWKLQNLGTAAVSAKDAPTPP